VFLEIDKPLDAVSFGMPRDQPISMGKDAANKIICHANVDCSAWPICEDVDPATHVGHRCLGSSLPGNSPSKTGVNALMTRQSIVLREFSTDGCAGQARA
jgi:hypothetical protein